MRVLKTFSSRAVWPPVPMVGLFILVYGILTGGLWIIQFHWQGIADDIFDEEQTENIYRFILISASVIYAIYRLLRFHPVCHAAYATWLKLTPWTSDKPLPVGPVHPVWQDVVVLGILTLIAGWHAHVDPAFPASAFGLTYLILMTVLLAFTRTWTSLWLLGFLWPTLMLPCVKGWPIIGLFAVLIILVYSGYRSSLRSFPWPFFIKITRTTDPTRAPAAQGGIQVALTNGAPAVGAPSNVGWPYYALSPKIVDRSITTLNSFFLSSLAGWWTYCIIKSSKMDPLPGLILTFAVLAGFVRLAIYCNGLAAPTSALGRLAPDRFAFPRFDKVFLTPLAAVMIGIVGGMIIRRSGSWYAVVESCVIALIWFVLLACGPTLRNWVLTGQHRFPPSAPD